jgi:HD-like signal output (HDOD) protein
MLSSKDLERTIKAIDALGATPAVLAKVAELAKDPNTELAEINALLRNDGPLVAEIIHISNSPYYAPATYHSNLTSAINAIGFREMTRVVNLSLSLRLFARDLPSYGISAHDYWSASVATGLVMEALAKKSGFNPEDAFTIGTLHAIGRILIDRVIEERRYTIYWDGCQPIQEWEQTAVGFDYAEAGALLLEHWLFPPPACDIIRWQLDPEKIPFQVCLLGALQFTLRLLALSGLNFEKEGWEPSATDPYLVASGLTPAMIVELISGCRSDFQNVLKAVDLN